jgi:hypothetical protein
VTDDTLWPESRPENVPVNSTRTVGLILAAVATALWVVIVAAFLATGPDDGVNIGAALLAFIAVPLSIAASVTLIVSRGVAARQGAPEEHPVVRRIAAGLAVVSAACLGLSLVLGPATDSIRFAVVTVALLVVGILAFVVSSAFFALPRNRRHS